MKKKSTKYELNKKDQQTVVLENINDKLGVMKEGLSTLDNKVETGFSNIETRFSGLETDINKILTDVSIIKSEVALIRHNQVTRDEFKFLESRVIALEKKVR